MSRFDEEFIPAGERNVLAARCRREYGWSQELTAKAIHGYGLFMHLKVSEEDWTATKLSPPLIIDKVWHQHILDVGGYVKCCNDFCGHLMEHNPDGGLDTAARAERIKNTKSLLIDVGDETVIDREIWSFDNNPGFQRRVRRREDAGDDVDPGDNADAGDDDDGQVVFTIHYIGLGRFHGRDFSKEFTIGKQTHFSQSLAEFANMAELPTTTTPLLYLNSSELIAETDSPSSIGWGRSLMKIVAFHEPDPMKELPQRAITIRFLDQTGDVTFFKLKQQTLMHKVINIYSERKRVRANSLRVLLSGEKVLPWQTPLDLELYDGDQLHVMLEQTGC